MPNHPTISAALNNCSLHLLTPELRADIQLLAENEADFPVTFKPAYEVLKTQFAAFYRRDEASFSWQAFHDLLGSYNEFDRQLLLGPVLRKVMAAIMLSNSEGLMVTYGFGLEEFHKHVENTTELQSNGRYDSLAPDEVFAGLAGHFGLKLNYHKDGQSRSFPDGDDLVMYEGRPIVEMFHQGGVEGAGAGGHWERTADAMDRTNYAQNSDTHLQMVGELFRQDSLEVTKMGLELLRLHVGGVYHAQQNFDEDCSEFFSDFDLTTAQIEKFLYNRLWVFPRFAQGLLGPLTVSATALIAELSDLEGIEYDQGLYSLLRRHDSTSITYHDASKQSFTSDQYQIALTLLTPPVPQIRSHAHRGHEVWSLRANEISALQSMANEYAQYIVFDHGFSDHLYAICNKPEIARELSSEFVELLTSDPRFEAMAEGALVGRAFNESFRAGTTSVDHGFASSSILSSPPRALEDEQGYASSPHSGDTCSIRDVYPGSRDFVVNRLSGGRNESWLEYSSHDFPISISPILNRQYTPRYLQDEIPTGGRSGKHVSFTGVSKQSSTPNTSCRGKLLFPPMPGVASPLREPRAKVIPIERIPFWLSNDGALQPAASSWNAYFWLRGMQCLLAFGGVCAVIAVLTCPPAAAALGITTVFGVTATEVAVTATLLAATSALLTASMFAVSQCESKSSSVADQSELRRRY